jgi:uncharacterized protein (DUF1330 family)
MKLPEFEPSYGPVLMLNMIKYKDREHYMKAYLPAFNRVVSQLGIDVKVVLLSKVIANIIAPENTSWDDIVLVEYPDAAAFKRIAESDLYQEVANPHRLAGTADLQLFMTQRFEL